MSQKRNGVLLNPLQNISVVLVTPKGLGNIGSTARAMKNMGVRELILVGDAPPGRFWERAMAVHARDVLKNAGRFQTLREAVAGFGLVIGTTCRTGSYRSHCETPRKLAPKILAAARRMRVALVFGPEEHGLTNSDIRHCQWLIAIPAHPNYPSLNVSQAAMVCLYELFVATQRKKVSRVAPRAPLEGVEQLYDHMKDVLLKIGFLNPQNPEHVLFSLRNLFGRAGLGERDVRILRGLFHQIEWCIKENGTEKARDLSGR